MIATKVIQKIKNNFKKQYFMHLLGAEIIHIEEGLVKITCNKKQELTQQHGFFHAGVLSSLLDMACGYAALSVMPKEADVLSVEFKTNLLRPVNAERIIATGKVVKSGKTFVFCEAKITDEAEEKEFTTMQGTMFCLQKNN